MRLIDVGVFLERERQIEEEGTVDRDMKTVLKVLHDLDTNYAILSHRWADEVDYLDIMELAKMENRDEIRERSGMALGRYLLYRQAEQHGTVRGPKLHVSVVRELEEVLRLPP
ncbi:hypothetical protein PISMIDRAFT_11920 [Pisolithus microcarpus 441]|uniref:Uncharacterized protein n=1 Tax=Pisolithus microcarpus 441 TaxID=765257 RepID=A0A0C9YYN1_9AGAM|nr:hypothetical protein PISMIDRAFT_11920 [Pisolithus microcarpus 441]